MIPPTPSPATPYRTFQRWFLISLLVANAAAFGIAALDRSWLAFGIAIVWGPALNGLFLLTGLITLIARKSKYPALPVATLVLLTIIGPIVLSALLYKLIFTLQLHGC